MAKPIILYDKGVRKNVRNMVSKTVNRLVRALDINHKLVIHVTNTETFRYDGDHCFGVFFFDRRLIRIAGRRHSLLTSAEWLTQELPDTIIHEFVHYEQFVQKRPMIERGVQLRINSIRKKINI